MSRSFYVLLTAVAVLACVPVASAKKSPAKHRKKSGEAVSAVSNASRHGLDADAVNNPLTQTPVGPKSEGPAVLRAQILLDRAHFSPGEIDGRYGENLRIAIESYQAAHNLPISRIVDAETWHLLNSQPEPVLVSYTIAAEDVAGPFEPLPPSLEEQSRLKSLGYQSAAEGLGEKFHSRPALLAELNAGRDLTKAGVEIRVPNVSRPAISSPASRVVVSKSKRTVSALASDGKVLAEYPSTIGSQHDPLPLGDWKITIVQQNPVFHYNPELFWDSRPKDSKADIPPGPNNPVGVVWIGLSKEHYGIHGTPEPGTIGHTESHGCIRLTNWDAEELSKMVKSGTPAILEE